MPNGRNMATSPALIYNIEDMMKDTIIKASDFMLIFSCTSLDTNGYIN